MNEHPNDFPRLLTWLTISVGLISTAATLLAMRRHALHRKAADEQALDEYETMLGI